MILRKSNNRVTMWVDPEFKRTFKSKASEEGYSVIEFSKRIANNIKKDTKKESDKFASFNFKI